MTSLTYFINEGIYRGRAAWILRVGRLAFGDGFGSVIMDWFSMYQSRMLFLLGDGSGSPKHPLFSL